MIWAFRQFSKSLLWCVNLSINNLITSLRFYWRTVYREDSKGDIWSIKSLDSSSSVFVSSLSKSELNLSLPWSYPILTYSNSIVSVASEWCYKWFNNLLNISPFLCNKIYWRILFFALPNRDWTILLKYPHKIGSNSS
jgi:hypothetical protein